jgi:hypothetical protein
MAPPTAKQANPQRIPAACKTEALARVAATKIAASSQRMRMLRNTDGLSSGEKNTAECETAPNYNRDSTVEKGNPDDRTAKRMSREFGTNHTRGRLGPRKESVLKVLDRMEQLVAYCLTAVDGKCMAENAKQPPSIVADAGPTETLYCLPDCREPSIARSRQPPAEFRPIECVSIADYVKPQNYTATEGVTLRFDIELFL